MVQFDNQSRQAKVKVVFYGPALGGKTTCLQHIHRTLDPERRTRLYSLNTASDRTLFFDLMSLDIAKIRGFRLTIQLYTVPGQVQYNATRRAVLGGADGVVFVADSQVDQRSANEDSLANLRANLEANGLDPLAIPLVLLYNKRDLSPLLPVADLDRFLNRREAPTFQSVATTGAGVMEGFSAICELTLVAVGDRLGLGGNPQMLERLKEQTRLVLRPYVSPQDGKDAREDPGDTTAVVRQQRVPEPDQPLSGDALVEEAVRANVAMTDLSAHLDSARRQLARKVDVLRAITELGRRLGSQTEPTDVLKVLVQFAVRHLQAQAAAVAVLPSSGVMQEAVAHGLREDPLLRANDEVGESLSIGLANARRPTLVARTVEGEEQSFQLTVVESAGFGSAVAVPLQARDQTLGLLTCYRARDRVPFDQDDLVLAELLGGIAAMGFATALAWRRLEDLNRDLEAQVESRTVELRQSFERERRLNQQLGDTSRLLEVAYGELAELDRLKGEIITRVTHELLTPASSLLTAAKVLERLRDGPPEKTVQLLGIVHTEAAKLVEAVQSVLQVSVLTQPGAPVEMRGTDVAELVRRATAPLRDLAQERGVRLSMLAPGALDHLHCHPDMLEAALRAVVKNGVEFSHEGGEVRVEVRRVGRDGKPWLQLKVTDTGLGIPEQELPHVFDALWQGANVLTGPPHGVGLGLAIAKGVVDRHGGTLTLTSEIAQGTEVTIEVPHRSSAEPTSRGG